MNIFEILKHTVFLAFSERQFQFRFPAVTFRIRGFAGQENIEFCERWEKVGIEVGRYVFSLAPITPENGLVNTLRL
jgi:hypothetical protein